MELLANYDIPVVNHPATDLDTDIKNARRRSI